MILLSRNCSLKNSATVIWRDSKYVGKVFVFSCCDWDTAQYSGYPGSCYWLFCKDDWPDRDFKARGTRTFMLGLPRSYSLTTEEFAPPTILGSCVCLPYQFTRCVEVPSSEKAILFGCTFSLFLKQFSLLRKQKLEFDNSGPTFWLYCAVNGTILGHRQSVKGMRSPLREIPALYIVNRFLEVTCKTENPMELSLPLFI